MNASSNSPFIWCVLHFFSMIFGGNCDLQVITSSYWYSHSNNNNFIQVKERRRRIDSLIHNKTHFDPGFFVYWIKQQTRFEIYQIYKRSKPQIKQNYDCRTMKVLIIRINSLKREEQENNARHIIFTDQNKRLDSR